MPATEATQQATTSRRDERTRGRRNTNASATTSTTLGWRQKQLATRASTVARRFAMSIAGGGQQRNNQPTTGAAKADGGW